MLTTTPSHPAPAKVSTINAVLNCCRLFRFRPYVMRCSNPAPELGMYGDQPTLKRLMKRTSFCYGRLLASWRPTFAAKAQSTSAFKSIG